MKWIKTSDRMPDISKRVLLYMGEGSIDIGWLKWHERKVLITGFDIEIKYHTRWSHGHNHYNVDVTHWCELEPPE